MVSGYDQLQGRRELAEIRQAEREFGEGGGVGYVACVDYDIGLDGGNGEGEGIAGVGADVGVGEEEEAG